MAIRIGALPVCKVLGMDGIRRKMSRPAFDECLPGSRSEAARAGKPFDAESIWQIKSCIAACSFLHLSEKTGFYVNESNIHYIA